MSNLLFGQSNSTQGETAQMIGARMKQSSKLNLKDSDLTPLEADPLSFTYNYYPQEVGQLGDGHYMKFHIYENTLTAIEAEKGTKAKGTTASPEEQAQAIKENTKAIEKKQKNLVKGAASNYLGFFFNNDGSSTDAAKSIINSVPSPAQTKEKAKEINAKPRDKFSHTHKKITQSIILYTPATTTFGYKANYTDAETGMIGGLAGAENFTQMLSAGGAGLASMLSSAMQVISPGIGAVTTRAFGKTTNPNMELAFESVPFRSFTFPFTFAPKNNEELQQAHKIIEVFKFHMHPALSEGESFFITPSQFEIEYMYRKGNNNYIPRVAKCVLESMDVDYSPGEKFTTLKPDDQGASPQIIKINLTFKEMLVLTKKNVAGGY
tara:strand:- start:169 stop:1305 length:1137 start_codon:yes stop_codon:yes gene_type:complete